MVAIGVAGTLIAGIAGTLIAQRWANQRDDKTWAREREREQDRWRREDEARTFEHRREAFEECYQAVKALARRAYDHGYGFDGTPELLRTGTPTPPPSSHAWVSTPIAGPMPLHLLRMAQRGSGVKTPYMTILTTLSSTSARSSSSTSTSSPPTGATVARVQVLIRHRRGRAHSGHITSRSAGKR